MATEENKQPMATEENKQRLRAECESLFCAEAGFNWNPEWESLLGDAYAAYRLAEESATRALSALREAGRWLDSLEGGPACFGDQGTRIATAAEVKKLLDGGDGAALIVLAESATTSRRAIGSFEAFVIHHFLHVLLEPTCAVIPAELASLCAATESDKRSFPSTAVITSICILCQSEDGNYVRRGIAGVSHAVHGARAQALGLGTDAEADALADLGPRYAEAGLVQPELAPAYFRRKGIREK
jgi:hypothetical protein